MPRMKNTKAATLTIRVGENTRSEIERWARLRDMNAGEFVRYCVRVYMDSTTADPEDS